jgi:UDP-GlcNAc:undecaprenyl-phosphate/decaprenyl-phosphate GlcNAc-1-phosphate transferase
MFVWPLLVCAIVGLLAALICIPFLVIRPQHNGARPAVDPTHALHHTHKGRVSRFGGIAFAAAFVVVSFIIFVLFPDAGASLPSESALVVVFGSLAMFLLGLLDDIRALGAKKKLLGQVLIAAAVYYSGVQIKTFTDPLSGSVFELGWLNAPLTILWLVSLTNLINIIDGIDGLAGGIALMLMALLTYVGFGGGSFATLCAAGMCGALIAFLCFNFPPAKIYMGDGGAYFLGFLIACLSILHSHKGTVAAALLAPLFALALPILDVSLAIIRRGLKGLPLFRPDRKHLHHRLVELGFSRKRAVLTLHAVSMIFLVLAFAVFWSQGRWIPFLFGLMCVVMLVIGGTFRFSRDWFQVGRVLGNSLEMRKETRYALTISRWLQMEAERSDSLSNLWADYTFMMQKVGFTDVRLVENSGQTIYSTTTELIARDIPTQKLCVDVPLKTPATMEFVAPTERMEPKLFELLTELSAEAWLKTVRRWHELNATETIAETNPALVSAGETTGKLRLPSLRVLPTALAEITLFERFQGVRRPAASAKTVSE